MGTVTLLSAGRRAQSARRTNRQRAIQLTLRAGDPAVDGPLGVLSLEARVTGARAPVRLNLCVNGELVATWAQPQGAFDLSVDEYGLGRHTVTARAVDALGRRAAASMIVVVLDVEPFGEGRASPAPA